MSSAGSPSPQQAAPASAIGVFVSLEALQDTIRALQGAGIDLMQLSVLGNGKASGDAEEVRLPLGFYTIGNHVKYWSPTGPLWNGLWGVLLDAAFFSLPRFGLLAIAGPFVSTLVATLERGREEDGPTVLAEAFEVLGVPAAQAATRVEDLLDGRVVLIATTEEFDPHMVCGVMEANAVSHCGVVAPGNGAVPSGVHKTSGTKGGLP